MRIRLLAVAAALSAIFLVTPVPAYAGHEAGHDAVAREGILGLDERLWSVENTALPEINSSIDDVQSQIDALSVVGAPSIISVDCDAGESIQAAVDAAAEGDTIEVSGTCNNQTVTIEKDRITLDGLGSAQIIGPVGNRNMISVRGSNVAIQNFAALTGDRNTIRVEKGGTALIDNNNIINSGRTGIRVSGSSYARIENGNVISGSGSMGIAVTRSSSAQIYDNTLTQNRNGILGSEPNLRY